MTPVAPRIVNVISYGARINDQNHFSWQGQYLVKSEGDAVASGVSCAGLSNGVILCSAL